MKKFIWISLFFILGCGSRSVQKQVSSSEIKQEVKTSEQTQKTIENKSEAQSSIHANTIENTQANESKKESLSGITENNSQKSNSENNSKSLKKTEYYPNGQKKSETEMSEQYSKVTQERDYYKNYSEKLNEDLKSSKKNQAAMYKDNVKASQYNNSLININKESLSKLDLANKEIKRLSDRKGVSFGALVWIVIASAIGGVLLWTAGKQYLPKMVKTIIKKS